MGKGKGFGKTILFGEHFVVYGLPAIASALSKVTTAKVERIGTKGYELVDNRPETPGYKKKKWEEYEKLIENVIKFMKINEGIKITLGGNLVAASGVGSSAACAAALARAINNEFNLGWNDKQINEAAYEGEKGPHGGSPGGVDNSCATFGGLLWVKKDLSGGPLFVEKINVKKPFEMVLANTGITTSTAETVKDVRNKRDADRTKFDQIFKEYEETVSEAKKALEEGNLEELGKLMNKNHKLLQEITVSCRELDEMVQMARSEGAIGAKLTGTGRGGLMQALTPGKELQEKVAKSLESKSTQVLKISVGLKQ